MDGGIASRLKQFDAYPKTLEDFRVKTFGGAVGKKIAFINSGQQAFLTLVDLTELSYGNLLKFMVSNEI